MNQEQMIENGLMNELGYFKLEQVEKLLAKINLNFENLEEYKEKEKDLLKSKSELKKVILERKKEVDEYTAEIEEINKKIAKIDHYQELNNGEISSKSMKNREQLQARLKELKNKSADSAKRHNLALSNYNNEKQKLVIMSSKIENSEKDLNDSMNTIKNVFEYCSKDLNEITTNIDNYQQEIAIGYQEGKIDTDMEIANLKNRLEFLPSHYKEIMDVIKQSDEYENTELKSMISEIKNDDIVVENQIVNENKIEEINNLENNVNSEFNQNDTLENNTNAEINPVQENIEINLNQENTENIQQNYMSNQNNFDSRNNNRKPMSLEQLAKEGPIFKDEARITNDYMTYQNASNLGYITDNLTAVKEQKNNNITNIEYAPEGLLAKMQYKFKKFQLTEEAFQEWCQNKQQVKSK